MGWEVIEIGWYFDWHLVFRDFVLGFKLYTQTACIGQGRFEKDLRDFSSKSYYSNSSKTDKRNQNFLPHTISELISYFYIISIYDYLKFLIQAIGAK